MSNSFLTLSIDGAIAHLRMNSPDTANAVTPAAHTELVKALRRVATDFSGNVLVISGEGKNFSAGGDLQSIEEAHHSLELRRHMTTEATEVFSTLNRLNIPVIGAVQGAAAGLGATIAAACDIVVANKAAKFVDPHVVLGLVAGDGGVIAWTQAIGFNRAKRYLLTGDKLGAVEAYAMGLVTDLVETPEDVLPAAMAIAQKIASYPKLGVQGTKRTFNKLAQQQALATLEFGLMLEAESFQAPELLENIQKMRAKQEKKP
jgi:enoyl-CoA hydratase